MADLLVDKHESIATLTFNRPEARNALSLEMRAMLRDALHEAELDDGVRCVVLRGAGDHFMAGGDIKSMSAMIEEPPAVIRNNFVNRIHDLHPIMFAMRRMPKPRPITKAKHWPSKKHGTLSARNRQQSWPSSIRPELSARR